MGIYRGDAGREETVCRIPHLGNETLDVNQWLWYNCVTEGEREDRPSFPLT